jgi:electron transport complex protein RnfG
LEQTLNNGPVETAAGRREGKFAQAWLVLLLALIFGTALAAVQVNLSAIVATNKLNETLKRIPELIWGADPAGKLSDRKTATDIIPGRVAIQKDGKTAQYSLFRVVHEGKPAGWVIKAGGQGYADKIEVLIGLDPDVETITGLFILEQKETPGLGNKITFPRWRNQFVRKKTDTPLVVGKGQSRTSGTIDAVTGATISSRSVTAIVNRTIGDIKGQLTPATIRFSERKL